MCERVVCMRTFECDTCHKRTHTHARICPLCLSRSHNHSPALRKHTQTHKWKRCWLNFIINIRIYETQVNDKQNSTNLRDMKCFSKYKKKPTHRRKTVSMFNI